GPMTCCPWSRTPPIPSGSATWSPTGCRWTRRPRVTTSSSASTTAASRWSWTPPPRRRPPLHDALPISREPGPDRSSPRRDIMADQLTFTDPVTRFPDITPPKQDQPEPGLDAELIPGTDRGEDSYRGTGRLEGRRALITGAASGIGAAGAIAFARAGADVALNHLPQEERDAQHVAEVIRAGGRTAVLLACGRADADTCRRLVEAAVGGLGGLDALVNNAGRQIAVESLEEIEDQQWEETFAVNIHAMFRLTKAALAHLPAGSTIVNT